MDYKKEIESNGKKVIKSHKNNAQPSWCLGKWEIEIIEKGMGGAINNT